MRLILCVLSLSTLIAFTACGNKNSSHNSSSGGAQNEAESDETPTKECGYAGNNNRGLLGTWYSVKTSKSRAVIESYTINSTWTHISRECHFKTGQVLNVAVDVHSAFDNSRYQVQDDAAKTTTDGSLSCGISASKGILTYEFYGSCLAVKSNGQTQYLISQKPTITQ